MTFSEWKSELALEADLVCVDDEELRECYRQGFTPWGAVLELGLTCMATLEDDEPEDHREWVQSQGRLF